jgi:hypothetical protein
MSEAFQTYPTGWAVAAVRPAIVRVEARRHTPGSSVLWSTDG